MEPLTLVTVPAKTATQLLLGVFLLPQDLCCNCGRREDLASVAIPLPTADLTGEAVVRLPFPHCSRCLRTARRIPPRLGRTISLFPLSFLLSAIVVVGVTSALGRRPGSDVALVLLLITVLAVALPFVLLRWRPPQHEGQTSRYQAVRIKLHKTFLGKVEAITFAFTNATYAQRFGQVLAPALASVGEMA
jgi:hypothetical protein